MTTTLHGKPGLAAITFSPHGGGIAAVSRLLHRVLGDATGQDVRRFTLARDEVDFDTSTLERARFGARVALAQMSGECDWMVFTHLGLATVQPLVPARRRPYAVFLHDIEAWEPLPARRRRVLAGAFLKLANSRYTARRVEAANPGCGPIVPCPLGLSPDVDDTSALVDRLPLELGPRAVVIVGRMVAKERYKGHDQLLAAWPAVTRAIPSARLVCVGEGDDVPRLREKASALGVGAQVLFPGFVDDATRRAIYRQAAAFAMPSRREGFGLVYLEAMAARLPCIGSVHDASAEVIVDGATGFLVDQDDRSALVDRLVTVLDNEPLRQQMGEAGCVRYQAEFTYEAFRARVTEHLASALPRRAPALARPMAGGV